LTGRSRAAWHTSFVIQQLNLLLDAGLCVNKLRPKHIFLTHGHNDHTLLSPAFVNREDPPDIYCPVEIAEIFDQFILGNSILNLGGLVGPHDPDGPGAESDGEGELIYYGDCEGEHHKSRWLNTHVTHGLRPGDVVPLRRLKDIYATAFACDHTVP
jgi:ribonuclease Z